MQDPEVNDYLNELGHRLVAASNDTKQDFEFFAVPDSPINAFALPGGYIGVHTGLILLAQNESELASVLAHEISHVTQRHMARMVDNQKNSMLMSLAGLALAVLASRAGGRTAARACRPRIAGTQALIGPEPAQLHARERIRGRPHRLLAPGRRRLRSERHGDVHGAAAARPRASSRATRRRTCARTRSPTSASPKPRRARRACPTGRFPTRSTSTSCARC